MIHHLAIYFILCDQKRMMRYFGKRAKTIMFCLLLYIYECLFIIWVRISLGEGVCGFSEEKPFTRFFGWFEHTVVRYFIRPNSLILYLNFSLCLSISLFVSLSLSPSLGLSLNLFLSLYIQLFFNPPFSLTLNLSLSLSSSLSFSLLFSFSVSLSWILQWNISLCFCLSLTLYLSFSLSHTLYIFLFLSLTNSFSLYTIKYIYPLLVWFIL